LIEFTRANFKDNPKKSLALATIHEEESIGWGILPRTCPYMGACNNQASNLCKSYRECLFYMSSLAGDIVIGKIDLVAAGLEVLAS
jgi:hypothetical protein